MGARAEPHVDRTIWVDGEFVPWAEATVHVLSHSLQRGSLIFDYMSVHSTARGVAVFRLGDHLERLRASAQMVGLPLACELAQLEAAIHQVVLRNPGCTAVKISAYLPSIEVDVVPADSRVSVAIAAYDPRRDILAHKPGPPAYRKTARLWIEKSVKNRRPDILPPQAKVAANYTSPMLAKWKARRAGYDEILLVDAAGCIAEGPTTNVFLVDREGTLVTPSEENVLLGITRRSILDIAHAEDLPVSETRVHPDDITGAAEVFLTGTTAGVWPVESVDGKRIGSVVPGPISQRLGAAMNAVREGRDPRFPHWLTFVEED